MIDLWISSGKDSMTWHFIHMWCSNMTNFQTLPGSASEIFCKDFGSTKITTFFGGEMKQSTTREFLTFLWGRSYWWETPQAFHTKKVFHKMKNQNISYTFLRWWFQICFIIFTTPIPAKFRWSNWRLTAISFPWGVEMVLFHQNYDFTGEFLGIRNLHRGKNKITPSLAAAKSPRNWQVMAMLWSFQRRTWESVVLLMVFCWKPAKLSSWGFLVVYLPLFTRFYTSERWLFGISGPSTVVGLNILNSDFAKWVG